MRMNQKRSSAFFATFCICLLLSGCLSSESSEESEEPEWSALIAPIIGTGDHPPVVANIRIIDGPSGQMIAFTEPLQGTFSTIYPSSCTAYHSDECVIESYNLTENSTFAPVRITHGSVGENNTSVWIISDIGILYPSNEKQGKVILYDYHSQESTTVIEGIGRTVCAEPGDLDGDGDEDLTLCEFGHDEGTVSWLENEEGNWTQHILDPRPGSIQAIPVDVDGDGDLDIVAVLSQNVEEVMLYRNDGTGNFTSESLYHSNLTYYGMSGLRIADLDKDGAIDIIFTNGDTMDFDTPSGINPNHLHGVAWLENNGDGEFTYHDLTRNWGAYDTALSDVDNDGDLDMILICLQTEGQFPAETERTQIILLEQQESAWVRHDVVTFGPHRMLTIAQGQDSSPGPYGGSTFLVASHDPLNQGGDLFTLAELFIVPTHMLEVD